MSSPRAPLTADNVLILFNGFLGMSGGDRHLLDMARQWSDLTGTRTRVALPRLAESIVADDYFDHMRVKYVDSPFEKRAVSSTLAVSACYLWRIIACSLARFAIPLRVVIASGHLPFDVIPALVLSWRYDAKWVLYVFHLIQMQGRQPSLRNAVATLAENLALWLTRRSAALVITDNATVRDQLVRLGFDSDRIRVTSLGISLADIQSVPASPARYDAVFFGRLVEHKGVFDLVEIWKQVVAQAAGAKLLIIGDGPARSALGQQFQNAALEGNVEFAGLVNPIGRVYALLKQARICVHPSHEEGWGISICEAMACGLPVVAYDLPAYRSVFQQGMITAALGNRHMIAEHVARLLTDESLRQSLGAAAAQQALEYDVHGIAQRQWQYLCEITTS